MKKVKDFLQGSKGDPDPPRTPIEEENTLQSRAIARFVDLLCEGEIEGLVNGEESIYFNNIPIRNSTSEYNFNGLSIEFKPGAPDGISLKDYPTSESEISVDIKLTEGNPIVRSISSTDVDDLRLTFTIPSLLKVKPETGDIKKNTVEWRIEIKPDGGSWTLVSDLKKHGKCVSAYQTNYRIENLERNYGSGPWEVRCTRLTADSDSNSNQNDIYWASYTQIINRVLIYPDTSLIGITLNSRQFGSRVPQRAYEVRGLRIQIPSNYNPVTRTYSGTWDGTFIRSYSNNPAWVWYDIVNNDRYGLGLEAEYIDKWSLYTIGKYCDELVDDGEGGTEPRFTFNGVLQSRNDAVHVLNMVSSAFRAMPYWGGGKASVSQDSPKDPVKLVTAANVIDGVFTYSYSALENRYTVCNVSWNDPEQFYKLTVEAVDDKEGLDRYGYKPADVTAVGCTSRGQAYRFGKWFLYTSLYETETITYKASWDQADLLPGDIISVLDNHEAATRHGGRIISASTNKVTLDQGITLEIGETYSITCIGKDGSLLERDIITASDGAVHSELTVDSVWPVGNEPQPDSMWIVSASNLEPKEYRVVTNTEVEPNIYEITAVIYDSNKYAEVEDGKQFSAAPITKVPDPNTPLDPPTNIQVEEYTYEDTGGTSSHADRKTGVILSWTHTRDVRFQNYEVQWKTSTGSFADNELIKTTDNQYDIKPLEAGEYTFRVRATGMTRESLWLTLSEVTVTAAPDAPPDISGLKVLNGDDDTTFNGRDCEIGWDALSLATDTTSPIVYDSTSAIPTHAAPFDSQLTKIKDYQIEILKTDDTHLRYEFTTENSFKYYFGMNQLDNGTPIRDIKFKVWARDVFDQLSNNPAILVVTNPAPSMSGLNPTVTDIFTGLKVDWSAITPSDNDLAKFKVYLDKSNPPTTEVAEVGVNTTSWVEPNLDAEETYRVQIEPYDEFGVGSKSNVVSGTPLKINTDDIETELTGRLKITDSQDNTGATILKIYDNVTGTDGIVYDSGDWINVKFPMEQLLDRVSVWADQEIHCYFSILEKDQSTRTFYKANASHELDSEGRLIKASNEADAQTNYWNADAGDGNINIALFPNGLVMSEAKIHILTNSVEVYEIRFTDQVIAEWIVARQLSAISADLGTIAAGILQSSNWGSSEGMFFDLDNEVIKFGGSSDPSLSWDGTSVTLAIGDGGAVTVGIDGSIEIGNGGRLTIGETGLMTIGNSIMLDSGEDGADQASIIISEPTTKDASGRLELSGKDYMLLNDGRITFFYWDPDSSSHLIYKNLTRIETGVAKNNELVTIPGIFKQPPSISVAPNVIGVYDKRYPNQSQTLKLEAASLEQYQTYRWRFRPKATLELADGVVGVSINRNMLGTTTVTSPTYSLDPLTRELSVSLTSSAAKYITSSYQSGYGKDEEGTTVYECYNYAVKWNVYLYYKVNGVWYNVAKSIRPGKWSQGAVINSVLNVPKKLQDITHFYIKAKHVGYYSKALRSPGSCGNGYTTKVNLLGYTSNLVAGKFLTEGTLLWTAIGA